MEELTKIKQTRGPGAIKTDCNSEPCQLKYIEALFIVHRKHFSNDRASNSSQECDFGVFLPFSEIGILYVGVCFE